MSVVRHRLTAWLDGRLARRTSGIANQELCRPTVVMAPHPDDEVLGCGGTISMLRRAGIPVQVLFLTDGSQSHASLIGPDRLAGIRREEAREAGARLGMDDDAIQFMGFPDGALSAHETTAIDRVAARLAELVPERVMWPHRGDSTPDHAATRRIGLAARRRAAPIADAWAFPIWFWCRWPWIRLDGGSARARLRAVRAGLAHVRMLDEFTIRVDLDPEARLAKSEALAAHRSQMVRRDGDPRWQTLGDVADGEYLARLLQPVEWFARDLPAGS